jgi:hypothetical protein
MRAETGAVIGDQASLSTVTGVEARAQEVERQHGEEIDRRAGGEDDRVIAARRVEHQPGRLGHDHPADAAREAAKTDHRPDRAFGEHVGRDRQERRRKGLVPGERETDQDDREPHIVEPGDEQQRQDETTGDHHRHLAREIDAVRPRWISFDESQPPKILPTSDSRYMMIIGSSTTFRSTS